MRIWPGGHLTKKTTPDVSTVEYQYDARGNRTLVRAGAASDPATYLYYDPLDQMTRIKSPVGDGTTFAFVNLYYDKRSNITKVTDPLDKVTSFTYDGGDGLVRVEDALGGHTSFDYDRWSQLTKVTDALGQATEYHYDEFQRLTKEVPSGGSSYATAYEYNLMDMLTKRSAPGSVVTSYSYDTARRLTHWQGPSNDFGSFGYYTNGQVAFGIDPTSGTTVGTSDKVANWLFTYDSDGRLSGETLYGADSTWSNYYELGKRTVGYDAAGRRTKLSFKSANRAGYLNLDTSQTYSYDSNKHRLVQTQREPSGEERAEYYYDDTDGRLTKVTYGTAARVEYGYNASGALTKIWHFSCSWPSSPIAVLGYQYDSAGNVTQLSLDDDLDAPLGWNIHSGRGTVSYQYDDLYRLTREYCSPGNNSYRREYGYEYWYDAVGNRTKMRFYNVYHEQVWNEETEEWEWVPDWETTTYQYSSRNELTKTYEDASDTTTTFSYDLRGNLTKRGAMEYSWDSQDHMTKVYDGWNTVQYKYDLMGRRVAKKMNSGDWKWYFYDGLKVIAEGTATNSRTYYTNSPAAIGGIITDGGGWYHYDRLGNVVATTGSDGAPTGMCTMDAFGNVLQTGDSYSGYLPDSAGTGAGYHLTTKEFDPDSGLYYFNARWYDPTTGRFVSEDKLLRIAPSLRLLLQVPAVYNRYSMVWPNPLGNADPTGLHWTDSWLHNFWDSTCESVKNCFSHPVRHRGEIGAGLTVGGACVLSVAERCPGKACLTNLGGGMVAGGLLLELSTACEGALWAIDTYGKPATKNCEEQRKVPFENY